MCAPPAKSPVVLGGSAQNVARTAKFEGMTLGQGFELEGTRSELIYETVTQTLTLPRDRIALDSNACPCDSLPRDQTA